MSWALFTLVLAGGVAAACCTWISRQRLMARALRHDCVICKRPFSQSLAECAGGLSAEEKGRLNPFEKKQAAFKVVCHECGAVNICNREGIPFKAVIPTE